MEEKTFKNFLKHPVVMLGAGGICSHVLPLIVQAGVEELTVWDPDSFAPVNRQLQLFGDADINVPKAEVLCREAQRLNALVRARAVVRKFSTLDSLDGIVIAGVDSMESRSSIFEAVIRQAEHMPLFIDGRLSRQYPHFAELYAIDPKDEWQCNAYRQWLFDDDAVPKVERPEVLAAHTPHALTALIGSILAQWVEGRPHPWKVTFDARAWHVEAYHAPAQQ